MTRAAVPRGNASPPRPGPDLPPEQGTSRQSEQTSEELGASGPRQAQPGGGRPAVLRLGRGFPSWGQQTVSKTPRAFRAGFSARPAQGTRQVLWPKTFWLQTSLSTGSVTRRLGADNHGGDHFSEAPMSWRPGSSHPGTAACDCWTHEGSSVYTRGAKASGAEGHIPYRVSSVVR